MREREREGKEKERERERGESGRSSGSGSRIGPINSRRRREKGEKNMRRSMGDHLDGVCPCYTICHLI